MSFITKSLETKHKRLMRDSTCYEDDCVADGYLQAIDDFRIDSECILTLWDQLHNIDESPSDDV